MSVSDVQAIVPTALGRRETFARRSPQELTVQALRPLVEEAVGMLRAALPAGVRLETALFAKPLYARVEMRALDIAISPDMLCCLDAPRWSRADLQTPIPDGDARVRAVIERWGLRWPNDA